MTEPIKMILMAPAGYGKTGALASLLRAGYNVRVIDLDNGITILKDLAAGHLANLDYVTITEPMRVLAGKIVPAQSTVWKRAVELLEHWKHTDGAGNTVDLGKPSSWGTRDVLVIDTLSKLSDAALNFHLAMNGALGKVPTGNEYRRNIGSAQALVSSCLQLLFDEGIRCNVIINTHVVFSKEDGTTPADGEEAVLFGFPKAIGKAIGPQIPTYFNDVLTLRRQGSTSKLCTRGQPQYGLKSSAPTKVKAEYALDTGLAQYFADVRSTDTGAAESKPSLTLVSPTVGQQASQEK